MNAFAEVLGGPRHQIGVDELGRAVYRNTLGGGFTVDGPGPVNALARLPRLDTRLDEQGRAIHYRVPDPLPRSVEAINALAGEFWRGIEAPARAARGEPVTLGDAWATALDYGAMAAPMRAPAGALRSGAAGSAAPEGLADEISRMLREGRGSEVTDEMMGRLTPNDQMRLAQLYEEGATGLPMPMDEASRMARAREMGFDTGEINFHGARAPFDAFRPSERGMQGPGVYVTQIAEDASGYALDHGVEGQNMLSVLVPRGRYASDDTFNDATFARFRQDRLPTYPDAAAAGVRDLQEQGFVGGEVVQSRRGFFGDESPYGVVQRNIYDPRNIRSRFARFDPRLSHLGNLSAGAAGAAMIAGEGEAQTRSPARLPENRIATYDEIVAFLRDSGYDF